MTNARAILNQHISEADFQDQVLELALRTGHLAAHIPDRLYKLAAASGRFDALPGAKSLPDTIIVGPDWSRGGVDAVMFLELKSERGRLDDGQREWLERVNACELAWAGMYRPSDIGEIEAILKGDA